MFRGFWNSFFFYSVPAGHNGTVVLPPSPPPSQSPSPPPLLYSLSYPFARDRSPPSRHTHTHTAPQTHTHTHTAFLPGHPPSRQVLVPPPPPPTSFYSGDAGCDIITPHPRVLPLQTIAPLPPTPSARCCMSHPSV
ncbi:unnamed protein product [Gadus morhua 'NCC']